MMKRVFSILIFVILIFRVFPGGKELERAKNYLKAVEAEITTPLTWDYSVDGKLWRTYDGACLGGRKFLLRTSLSFKKIFAGIKVEGKQTGLKLRFAFRGLVIADVLLDGKKVAVLRLNAGDATPKEEERFVLLGNNHGGEHILTLSFENKGFLPPRGNYLPPRKKPPEEKGIYLCLRSSEVFYKGSEEALRLVKDWISSMKVAYFLLNPVLVRRTFTGKPYKIEDRRRISRQKLKQLKSRWVKAVFSFDLPALRRGDWDKVRESIKRSYREAHELSRFAWGFKVFIVGNSHIDVAWLWRIYETMHVARNTFYTVIKNMAEYPELHYAQSSAIMYRWMEEFFPEVFREIKEKVKEGRWEIVGGMWLEPDCNLISGESWVRQILYGKRYFREKFGVDVKIGWNIDSFGYNWNMPQIYKKSGIDYFVTQKLLWNDTTVFPYYVFWWEGVDGTRILSYFPPVGYTSTLRLIPTVKALSTYNATTGYKNTMILYGLGDHGGGPNREILDRVRGYANLKIKPQFVHSTAMEFFRNVERDLGDSLPVWKNELYLEYHRGTYTTHSEIKKNNRKSEALLMVSEELASIAHLLGGEYPSGEFERAWELVMTNQFHDVLPGSGITPIYRDAMEFYHRAYKILKRVNRNSLSTLISRIDTQVKGEPVFVYNPLSWRRKDYVKVKLPEKFWGRSLRLMSPEGKAVPMEVFKEGGDYYMGFIAEVPPLGYAIYSLEEGRGPEISTDLKAHDLVLENRFYRMKIDPRTGNMRSFYSKELKREFIAQGKQGNVLQIYEDIPENWDAWNIGYTGRMWELNRAKEVKLIYVSPVRAVIRVKKTFLGLSKSRYSPTEDFPSSFFTQDITLYSGLDRVDVKMKADWWEDHMFLKVAFPVSISSKVAYYEIPFAAIGRSTEMKTPWEKARFEVPAHRWGDLSDGKAGISFFNDSKYGYDIHNGVMKLSLLRSPLWPDPTADRGKHNFTYSLYTHKGNWNQGETVRRGYELNTPMVVLVVGKHPGKLPKEFSFFSVDGRDVVLAAVKKSEDGDYLVFRLYEAHGRDAEANLKLFRKPKLVYEANLMEEKIGEVKFKGRVIPMKFKPFEIRTLKIKF